MFQRLHWKRWIFFGQNMHVKRKWCFCCAIHIWHRYVFNSHAKSRQICFSIVQIFYFFVAGRVIRTCNRIEQAIIVLSEHERTEASPSIETSHSHRRSTSAFDGDRWLGITCINISIYYSLASWERHWKNKIKTAEFGVDRIWWFFFNSIGVFILVI